MLFAEPSEHLFPDHDEKSQKFVNKISKFLGQTAAIYLEQERFWGWSLFHGRGIERAKKIGKLLAEINDLQQAVYGETLVETKNRLILLVGLAAVSNLERTTLQQMLFIQFQKLPHFVSKKNGINKDAWHRHPFSEEPSAYQVSQRAVEELIETRLRADQVQEGFGMKEYSQIWDITSDIIAVLNDGAIRHDTPGFTIMNYLPDYLKPEAESEEMVYMSEIRPLNIV